MKRFVLVLGLLLSSAVSAQDFDTEYLRDRPLWYSDDLTEIVWLVVRDGWVAGHRGHRPEPDGPIYWSFFEAPSGAVTTGVMSTHSLDRPEEESGCVQLRFIDENTIRLDVLTGCFSIGYQVLLYPH